MRRLGIFGGGRAAWAFASSWRDAGGEVLLSLRPGSGSPLPGLLAVDPVPPRALLQTSDCVAIAVSDRAIPDLAREITGLLPPTLPTFHVSGSTPSSILAPHPMRFSLHPLRSLPQAGEPASLSGSLLVFEGVPDARPAAIDIARALNAVWGEVESGKKLLYHSAAVIAANHVAALLSVAEELMSDAGLREADATWALTELARSAIANWERSSGAARFTGPVARGDAALVAAEIGALEGRHPARELYRELSRVIARHIGASTSEVESALAIPPAGERVPDSE